MAQEQEVLTVLRMARLAYLKWSTLGGFAPEEMAERRTTAHLFRVWYNHDSVTDAARLAAAMELLDGGDTAYELAVSFEELVFMRSKFQLAAVDTPAEPTPKQEAAAACRQLRHVRAAYVKTLTTAAFAPEELEVRRRAVREFDMWVDSGDVADTTKFQACVQFMMSSQKNAASFDLFVIVEGKYRL